MIATQMHAEPAQVMRRLQAIEHDLAERQNDVKFEDRGYETPCWIWQRSIKPSGYGEVWVSSTERLYAHRWTYRQLYGALPAPPTTTSPVATQRGLQRDG